MNLDTKINNLLEETLLQIKQVSLKVFDMVSIKRELQIKLSSFTRVY